jgi:hypothetical protein
VAGFKQLYYWKKPKVIIHTNGLTKTHYDAKSVKDLGKTALKILANQNSTDEKLKAIVANQDGVKAWTHLLQSRSIELVDK